MTVLSEEDEIENFSVRAGYAAMTISIFGYLPPRLCVNYNFNTSPR